jgi:two-component system nitrate/nitrite response regulator NarL
VAAGQSNKLIGRTLSISEGTVKVHVKHLLKKLGFRSRVEAAVWATELGVRIDSKPTVT